MNEASLRAAYARGMAERGATRAACPTAESVRDLATAEQHDDSSAATFDHVMACSACLADYELVRSIHRAQVPAASAPMARRWAPWALAATAIVAVALGRVFVKGDETTRGSGDGVQLVAPAGRVALGDSLKLVWHPVIGTQAYRVELTDAAGAPLHSVTTTDTSIALAGVVVPVGTSAVEWLVVAVGPGGSERRSPLARVAIVR